MARKVDHKIRIATRGGAVAVSYAAYQRVASNLVKCNTVFAVKKGDMARVVATLEAYALEAPEQFSEAARYWLGVVERKQAA